YRSRGRSRASHCRQSGGNSPQGTAVPAAATTSPSPDGAILLPSASRMTPVTADPVRLRDLAEKALGGGPLSPEEGLLFYRGLDQTSLGMLANEMRLRLNPPGADGKLRVTYIVDRNINPTNVCVTDCGFCAFY